MVCRASRTLADRGVFPILDAVGANSLAEPLTGSGGGVVRTHVAGATRPSSIRGRTGRGRDGGGQRPVRLEEHVAITAIARVRSRRGVKTEVLCRRLEAQAMVLHEEIQRAPLGDEELVRMRGLSQSFQLANMKAEQQQVGMHPVDIMSMTKVKKLPRLLFLAVRSK